MTNLCSPNSKLMNPEKKLYSLIDINFFLMLLGLFPLRSVPTSKIIIYFHKNNLSIAIQPVEIWKTEMLEIPNYEAMRMEIEQSMFPHTRMQIDLEFYPDNKYPVSKKVMNKIARVNKALGKRGKNPEEIK